MYTLLRLLRLSIKSPRAIFIGLKLAILNEGGLRESNRRVGRSSLRRWQSFRRKELA